VAACLPVFVAALAPAAGQEPAAPATGASAPPATVAASPGSVAASRPNLILITIDSLRSDRVFPPADRKHDMPKLEALAAAGVRFERAYAASPSTAPSHASLLTGLEPAHHGLRHDVEGAGMRLADGVVTLAERLRRAGYETLAVVGTDRLDSDTHLDRGFDRYDDENSPGLVKLVAGRSKERRASEVFDAAARLLDQRNTAKPLFLFVNFHDPHADYEAPEPFKTAYKDDPYGGELASLDPQLAGLVEKLREGRLLDRSVLVVAGAHGEALGEHQEIGHGIYLYETTIRVPLVVLASGVPGAEARGKTIAAPVSLTDVTPTLLDLAGLGSPAGKARPSRNSSQGSGSSAGETAPLDGISFAGLLGSGARGNPAAPPHAGRPIWVESVQPRRAYGWGALWALIDGDHKVVQGTFAESFDLAADPAEEHPIQDPPPKWTKKLLAQGQGRLGDLEDVSADRKKEILAAVDAFGVPWADAPFCVAKDEWPDPRLPAKVAVNGPLFTAGIDQAQGIVGRSTRVGSQVLETDADNFSVFDMIAFLGIRNRWGDSVLDDLELLQCRYPFRMNGYHWLAHYYEQKGDNERALKAMDLMELVDPRSEDPEFDRAVLLSRMGKLEEGLAHLEKAIKMGADDFPDMRHDPRLGAFRNDPRFRAMVGLEPLPATPAPSAPGSK
jgi:arylsulfatase A-like enzyme